MTLLRAKRPPTVKMVPLQDPGSLYDDVFARAGGRTGGEDIERPWGCDWFWRPAFWTASVDRTVTDAAPSPLSFGSELAIFHDCAPSTIKVSQHPDNHGGYGLQLDAGTLHGSFLSAAISLPTTGLRGLRANHLIRVNALFRNSRPCRVFFRLNIKHGPNTDQIVRECEVASGWEQIDFDLAYINLNERRLEKIWLDLIFQDAGMARIDLRDVCFMRHPRADI